MLGVIYVHDIKINTFYSREKFKRLISASVLLGSKRKTMT
jgi:hypothetical protein